MRYDIPTRLLGSSDISESAVGLGCNRIGEDIPSDDEWIRMLRQAADWGITVYDTATAYAGGRSQELVGKAFGNRDDVVIATKVSPIRDEHGRRFTYESIIEGVENCLRLLRRETIDVLQTHGSGSLEEVSNPDFAKAMDRLQQQGKIRLRASATFDAEGARHAIEHGLVDVLQVTYNLVDRAHSLPVLPLAAERGVGLLARMPYQRGSLTGKFRPGEEVAEGHRAKLQGEKLADDIAAAERFRELGERREGGMAELAMQYVLSETRVSATIPGARSIEQVRTNIENALAPPLTDEEAREVERIQEDA